MHLPSSSQSGCRPLGTTTGANNKNFLADLARILQSVVSRFLSGLTLSISAAWSLMRDREDPLTSPKKKKKTKQREAAPPVIHDPSEKKMQTCLSKSRGRVSHCSSQRELHAHLHIMLRRYTKARSKGVVIEGFHQGYSAGWHAETAWRQKKQLPTPRRNLFHKSFLGLANGEGARWVEITLIMRQGQERCLAT